MNSSFEFTVIFLALISLLVLLVKVAGLISWPWWVVGLIAAPGVLLACFLLVVLFKMYGSGH